MQTEKADGNCDRQFEEVGCTDQASGRCNFVGQFQSFGRAVGKRKNSVGLYQQRYRDIARTAEDRFLGEIGAEFRDAYEG